MPHGEESEWVDSDMGKEWDGSSSCRGGTGHVGAQNSNGKYWEISGGNETSHDLSLPYNAVPVPSQPHIPVLIITARIPEKMSR